MCGIAYNNNNISAPHTVQTSWEEGLFKVRMIFKDDYPTSPPKCENNKFDLRVR